MEESFQIVDRIFSLQKYKEKVKLMKIITKNTLIQKKTLFLQTHFLQKE